jgi:hypothetical protein
MEARIVLDTCSGGTEWEYMSLEETREFVRGYWNEMESSNWCEDDEDSFEGEWETLGEMEEWEEPFQWEQLEDWCSGFGYTIFNSEEDVKEWKKEVGLVSC